MVSPDQHLLQVQELRTYFYTFEGTARAVDDVSFSLNRGETLGLVGESGCGKSVTALSIMRLVPEPPGRIVHGRVEFDGTDLLKLSMDEMRHVRGNRISMIFQEPMTSLNPVFTIGDQISEMFILHQKLGKKESWNRAVEMLRLVQIPSPEKRIREYPHQLSGGMRQRAMIAMALSCDPEILIADEPTTALDVTIQAQVLDLMLKLKEDFDAAIILITHDLGVVAEIAQRIEVMYAGKVVEEAETIAIFEDPKHPYTRGLLRSIPKLGQRARYGRQRLQEISGMVPSLYELPPGCTFFPRCPEAKPVCRREAPRLIDLGGSHKVRCWLYQDG
ncbi:MAG: ABC transporter ATP-binding protein [Deltaproteobacteria bacterium]|nr:ABC transporter ATP-binding protein [Deltaproteobacteria bacterium]MBW2123027.1 ABC transporter ATP-binding protein [Deltaproteobacteria bacterium]